MASLFAFQSEKASNLVLARRTYGLVAELILADSPPTSPAASPEMIEIDSAVIRKRHCRV